MTSIAAISNSRPRYRRAVSALLAFLILGSSTTATVGCFGTFPATNALYKLNGKVPSGILRSIVMWVLGLLGIYGITVIVDFFILNLIEFWTGSKMADGSKSDDGATLRLSPYDDSSDQALVAFTAPDGTTQKAVLVRVNESLIRIVDEQGRIMGSMTLDRENGLFAVQDAEGLELARRDVGQFLAMAKAQ